MAFDDLDDAATEQQQQGASDEDDYTDDQAPGAKGSTGDERGTTSDSYETNPEQSTSTSQRDPLTEPAFEFSDSTQAQIYPRESTFEEFQDALDIEVKRLLRERGIRNEAGRELHEAVLRVAIENPELVANQLEQDRKY